MARFDFSGAAEMAQTASLDQTLFQLGMAASTGRDGDPDLVAAHKWFNLAAIRGNPDAARHRQEIALELDPREVAEAQRAAREWLRQH